MARKLRAAAGLSVRLGRLVRAEMKIAQAGPAGSGTRRRPADTSADPQVRPVGREVDHWNMQEPLLTLRGSIATLREMAPRREIGSVKRAVRAQARNRTPRAVERTVPFGLAVDTRIVRWHVRHGRPDVDLAPRRAAAPWYRTTAHPSFPDMFTAVRRVMVAAEHPPGTPGQPPVRRSKQSSAPGRKQREPPAAIMEVTKPEYELNGQHGGYPWFLFNVRASGSRRR